MKTLSPVGRVRARLGDDVVLLAITTRKKNPTLTGWQKVQRASMDDPAYLDSLNHGGNIGVLLGAASGGLCALDFDTDADADAFLAANPELTVSFRTRGKRGCQIWIRAQGVFPASGDAKDGEGRKVAEWRADGRQSVVSGVHPDGMEYRWLVDAEPMPFHFGNINWPADWRLPWNPDRETPEEAADRELIERHGAPFTRSEKGKLTLNPMHFVARFARPGDTLFEPGEGCFYGYDAELGLWHRRTEAAIKIDLATMLKEYADFLPFGDGQQIITARTAPALAGMAGLLQGFVEESDAFTREHGVVHVANGMLHLNTPALELRPFAVEYRSRNVAPVAYDPTAECPRFKRELLESALAPDDVFLVQRYAGACLLGRNIAQKILVLTGTAGGGKSTLLEILERILGLDNVGEIRTEHLSERFEIARFIGKTLLTGKDVQGRFLEAQGAHKLKALVGHDLLDTECKGSRADFKLRGDFAVIVTCNSRLRVRLDGDADAWRRRLLIVKYERPKPERPERDFANRLLQEEGAGILRWMVDGARAHLAELAQCGDFRLTGTQRQRVNSLLAESDSVREFVRQRTEARAGADVTVYDLAEAYAAFCDAQGWEPMPTGRLERELPDAMQDVRRAARRNDIQREGKARRGFAGVQLTEEAGEAREV